jgi:hypothetical protein
MASPWNGRALRLTIDKALPLWERLYTDLMQSFGG